MMVIFNIAVDRLVFHSSNFTKVEHANVCFKKDAETIIRMAGNLFSLDQLLAAALVIMRSEGGLHGRTISLHLLIIMIIDYSFSSEPDDHPACIKSENDETRLIKPKIFILFRFTSRPKQKAI